MSDREGEGGVTLGKILTVLWMAVLFVVSLMALHYLLFVGERTVRTYEDGRGGCAVVVWEGQGWLTEEKVVEVRDCGR
jgi:hypothetical protein